MTDFKQEIESQNQHYKLFMNQWIKFNPKPSQEKHSRSERLQWLVILVASIIVSSMHNIPFLAGGADDFGSQLRAVSLVIMFEFALVKIGERITKYLPESIMELLRVRMLLFAGVMILFVTMMGNMSHQLELSNYPVHQTFKGFVTLIAGLTAPLMALIVGIMYTSLSDDLTAELKSWEQKRKSDWTRYQNANMSPIKVSKPVAELSEGFSVPNENGKRNGNGKRIGKKMERAIAFFEQNPDAQIDDQLIAELRIGKTTLYDAKQLVDSAIAENEGGTS